MPISSEHLQHLAALAYLELDQASIKPFSDDINAMINFVSQLQQVATSNVTPMSHPMDGCLWLRDDLAVACDFSASLKQLAPQFENNLYLVPNVI